MSPPPETGADREPAGAVEPDALHALLRSRRSLRRFSPAPIGRPVLERLLAAAITAPSSTNRQPWRFTVVTNPDRRRAVAGAVRARADEMKAIVARGHHAADFGNYADFFHEPLESAAAIVIPQYREHEDLIASFIASGGGDPARFTTSAAMHAELASTSAAVMLLLVAAHAEGLGGCWMAGPMIARDEIGGLCGIVPPWRMLGAVALGHPDPALPVPASPGRKSLDRVAEFIE
jgi:coenzyme F420-0:L-glutamate ligase/coenzyme F420-1:gamma-L-glutamate ligase